MGDLGRAIMIPQVITGEVVVVGSGCHRQKEEEKMVAVGWVWGRAIFSLSSTSIACGGEDERGGDWRAWRWLSS